MFEKFKKLWSRNPEPARDDSGGSNPSGDEPLPAAQLSQADLEKLQNPEQPDPEAQELDTLYRQALVAMDAVEIGCETVSGEIKADDEQSPPEDIPAAASVVDGHSDAANGSQSPFKSQQFQSAGPPVTPQQILEAALFVGGTKLTLKRLCSLLNDEFSTETVEMFVDDLNRRYDRDSQPYQIHFGKGGYRMNLRSEFDAVRNRVFGLGPREFKLSQVALEVLSLVAYQQPISGEQVLALRGTKAANVLRQLLRRELIQLERSEDDRSHVLYRTTPRFLQAFGVSSLDDLPQADDLAFK